MRPSRHLPQNECSEPNNMRHKHHRPHPTRHHYHHHTYHSFYSTNSPNRDGDMCPAAAIQVMAMEMATVLTVDTVAYTVSMEG